MFRPPSAKELWDSAPRRSRLTVAAAALGLAFCLLYSSTSPDCGATGRSDVNATYGWLATIVAAAGMLGAIACLAERRWLAALIGLGAGAAAILIAALSGLC